MLILTTSTIAQNKRSLCGGLWRFFPSLELSPQLKHPQPMDSIKEKLESLALENLVTEKNSDEQSKPKSNGLLKSKKLSHYPLFDFSLPIYIQRRRDFGLTISCPDMNITHHLPQAQQYESFADFCADLNVTLAEVDRLAIEEFKSRDNQTQRRHRDKLFPRGLKDHLEVDIHKLTFKPPVAALLTTKSERTWQRWCKERRVKRRSNGLKWKHKHYQIPFSEIEPHLREEFVKEPKLILNYVTR